MKVLIAGLSDPSAVAMERIVGVVYPGAEVIRQRRGVSMGSPKAWSVADGCDLCIVDLIGLGLARWTDERQLQLQSLVLNEHCAIVIAPPGDGGGWLQALQASGTARLTLQHPLTATTVRKALADLRAQDEAAAKATSRALSRASRPAAVPIATQRPAPRVALPELVELHDVLENVPDPDPDTALAALATVSKAHVPVVPVVPVLPVSPVATAEPAQAEPPPALAVAPVLEEAGPDPFGLTPAALNALRAACPEAGQNAYLNLICQAVLKPEPQEFQIGSHSGVVIHSAQNWVASNISAALRKRLTAHAMMLQIVESRPLAGDQALARAMRLFGRRQDGRRPLDTFMWNLAYTTFEADLPHAKGDLRFQLERSPNFTRMEPQPDVFIQLALLCLRAPQSLLDLQRSFSRHDPRLVTMFVVCAVLSGTATVLPSVAEVQAGRSEAPAPAKRRNRPGLQFFRSLLEKLF